MVSVFSLPVTRILTGMGASSGTEVGMVLFFEFARSVSVSFFLLDLLIKESDCS